jgi:hypothetical protein
LITLDSVETEEQPINSLIAKIPPIFSSIDDPCTKENSI